MPKLTDKILRAFAVEPGRKDRLAFDTECQGLGVRATAKGTRTFIVQWTDPATKRKVREPLGVWGAITVDQARAAARARLGDVARGIDPAAERKRRRDEAAVAKAEQALTLDKLIGLWADLHLKGRRPRYRDEAQRALRAAFADQLSRPASALDKATVVRMLDGIAAAGRDAMATKVIAFGRACFGWAEKRGSVASNPFRSLPMAATSAARDRVLTPVELAEAWAAAGAIAYPFGPFYRVAILTMQRREEVAGMRWSELSDDLALWTIPAERMKNSRPHDVHLPEEARAVLRTIPRRDKVDLVFTTTGKTPVSGYSRAKAQLDAAIVEARAKATKGSGRKPAPLAPWVLHDLRRTGVSHLAALGFDSIIADKLLAHKPAKLKGVASVYQRQDFAAERRRALEVWAAHVAGTAASGNVVELRTKVAR